MLPRHSRRRLDVASGTQQLESGRRRADLAHVDRRALPGLLVGAVGGVIGIAGAISGSRLLALAAGLAALGSGAAVAVVAGRLRHVEEDAVRAVIGTFADPPADAARHARSAPHASEPLLAPTLTAEEAPADAAAVEAAAAGASAALDGAPDPDEELEPRPGPASVFDQETGLLDERVFVVSFERKVAAARRHLRPLCLVLVDVGAGLPDHPSERSRALQQFGTVVRDTLRDADIACRLSPVAFGLILEDTPEAGGVWAAERLQIALACQPGGPKQLVAAVAAYPNHGLVAQDVLARAQDALTRARGTQQRGMGTVEVASIDLT
jgi:GGDEF domain-containing protein